MGNDRRLRLTSNLNLQIQPNGKWSVCPAASRADLELSADAVSILMAFSEGALTNEVFARVSESFEISQSAFESFIERLEKAGVFVSESNASQTELGERGFADLSAHYSMLLDTVRVRAYQKAIEATVRGKEVLEIGCGTGVLTLLALKAGAKHVTVIEESTVAHVAAAMFRANGFENQVTLLRGNSRDVSVPRKCEVLIHELFGTDPLGENVLSTLRDAQARLLTPNAILLPSSLDVYCLGLRAHEERAAFISDRLATANTFSSLYGLDFAPFVDAYRIQLLHKELAIPKAWNEVTTLQSAIMTKPAHIFSVNLHDPQAPADVATALEVLSQGKIGASLMYFTAHFGDVVDLSNSPWNPPTSWGFDIRMSPKEIEAAVGAKIPLHARVVKTLASDKIEIQIG